MFFSSVHADDEWKRNVRRARSRRKNTTAGVITIQRQKMPLIFVDPMHFDFGRAGIVGRGKTQKRNVILLQNKFHIVASLSLFF